MKSIFLLAITFVLCICLLMVPWFDAIYLYHFESNKSKIAIISDFPPGYDHWVIDTLIYFLQFFSCWFISAYFYLS